MLRLKELREKRKLTQDGLGREFGLSGSTISLYERGQRQPDYETLMKLADFFGVSIDYLLGRDFDFLDYQQRLKLQEIHDIKKSMAEAKAAGDKESYMDLGAELEILQESYDGVQFGVTCNQAARETYTFPPPRRKTPAPVSGDGLSLKDQRLVSWFRSLSPEKQRAILIAQDAPAELL